MEFSRRETMALGLGAAVMTVLPFRANAAADDAIAASEQMPQRMMPSQHSQVAQPYQKVASS